MNMLKNLNLPQSIVDIRNPYVHKDFMTFEVFNNFINLVFNEIDDIFDFNDLGKI